MTHRILLLLAAWTLALSAAAAPLDSRIGAPSTNDDWRSLATPHFIIHFRRQDRHFADRAAAVAEAAHQRLTTLFRHTPTGRTDIIINDATDSANGGATPLPFRQIEINMTPPDDGDLLANQDWMAQLLSHEYTHSLHHDRAAQLARVLRRSFGNISELPLVLAAYPQLWGPNWLAEGLAVRTESMDGQGRSHSDIYAAKIRAALDEGFDSLSQKSFEGYNPVRWPFGGVYLYGAFFFAFLDDVYGPEKTLAYLAEYDDNIVPWRMDHRAREALGVSSRRLWEQYRQYLEERFPPRRDKDRASLIITDTPWLNLYPTVAADGSLYYYHADLVAMPSIRRIAPDGTEQTVLETTDLRLLEAAGKRGLLIGRTTLCDNRNRYTDLYLLAPEARSPRRLTRCARIAHAAWDERNARIVAVQGGGGKTRLVAIAPDNGEVTVLFQPPAGERIGRIDVAPDGGDIAMQYYRPDTGWNITLLRPDGGLEALTGNGDIHSHPRISHDGKALFFIAHHDGRVELRRLDIGSMEIETLSRSNGYIADFAVGPGDALTLLEYTGHGLRLRHRGEDEKSASGQQRYPAFTDDGRLEADETTKLANALLPKITALPDQPYRPLTSMRPRGWLPILNLTDRQDSSLGVLLGGRDALGFHQWQLAPLWFDHEAVGRAGGFFQYGYDGRAIVSASRKIVSENSDERIVWSEENRAQLLLQGFWNRHDRGWRLFAGTAWEELRRHDGDGITETRDRLDGAGVAYDSLHDYGQSIIATDGIRFRLSAERYAAGGSHDGTALIASLAATRHLGGNHHLAIELLGGAGGSGIAPFSLGGAEDLPEEIGGITPFGQRRFALPGYERGDIATGNRFARATAAWRFPVASLYDGFLAPPVGLGKVHGALFAESAVIDAEAGRDHELNGIGVELTTDLLIGFDSFSVPVTIGAARGLDSALGTTSVYLRTGFGF